MSRRLIVGLLAGGALALPVAAPALAAGPPSTETTVEHRAVDTFVDVLHVRGGGTATRRR